MILADKIIQLRKKNGWSQEQLGEQLDVSRQSVSKWESGLSIPDLEKILKMSELFGVSTDYLLKDEIEEALPSETEAPAETARLIEVEYANEYMDLVRESFAPVCLGCFGPDTLSGGPDPPRRRRGVYGVPLRRRGGGHRSYGAVSDGGRRGDHSDFKRYEALAL